MSVGIFADEGPDLFAIALVAIPQVIKPDVVLNLNFVREINYYKKTVISTLIVAGAYGESGNVLGPFGLKTREVFAFLQGLDDEVSVLVRSSALNKRSAALLAIIRQENRKRLPCDRPTADRHLSNEVINPCEPLRFKFVGIRQARVFSSRLLRDCRCHSER
jgi:hypothetical protein